MKHRGPQRAPALPSGNVGVDEFCGGWARTRPAWVDGERRGASETASWTLGGLARADGASALAGLPTPGSRSGSGIGPPGSALDRALRPTQRRHVPVAVRRRATLRRRTAAPDPEPSP